MQLASALQGEIADLTLTKHCTNDSYFTAMTCPQSVPATLRPSDIHDALWGVLSDDGVQRGTHVRRLHWLRRSCFRTTTFSAASIP